MSISIKPFLAALVVGAVALTAGCSTVEDQKIASNQSALPSSGNGSGNAAGVEAAKANVAATRKPVGSFDAPGPAIKGVDKVQDKTVYFVPANYQIPLFQGVKASLEAALGTAGVKVTVCDGKANPEGMASCIQQGVDAKAAAIVTGSIPQEQVSVAFEQAKNAGIPLVNMMTVPAGDGDPTKVAYVTPDFIRLQALAADAVIADSNGTANVLVVKITDTPATKIWIEQGALAEYEKNCPDCKVTTIEANTGSLDKLASLVTSELTKNPNITYVQTEFDFEVQPVVQGIQGASRSDVKISTHDGVLPVMQMLKNDQFVFSEVGYNVDALAWYGADQALRMMAGQPSNQMVQFPYQRMFSADNIGELKLTPDAEKSGEWFGSTGYQAGFKKLWGVN